MKKNNNNINNNNNNGKNSASMKSGWLVLELLGNDWASYGRMTICRSRQQTSRPLNRRDIVRVGQAMLITRQWM